MSYYFKDIAKIIAGKTAIHSNPTIGTVFIDSRSSVLPQSALFFAIEGNNHNGHNYILDLYQREVKNFVVRFIPENVQHFEDINFIIVDDTLLALQQLAAWHRSNFTIPVVGITGSNGKTIVKEWLFQLLDYDYRTTRSPKSYNSQVGVPLSVWQLDTKSQWGIFEAGISQPDEMKNLQKIIDPEWGIFTNIGDAHQENFQSLEQKVKEKLVLFQHCKYLIYCKDYEVIHQQILKNNKLENTQLLSWSEKSNADLEIVNVQIDKFHTEICARFKNEEIRLKIPFTDKASIENCIHLWLMLLTLNIPNTEINRRMQYLSPVAMRLELKQGINNCTLINDTYNSDLGSLSIALDFLRHQQQHQKKTLILSDIVQTQMNQYQLYAQIAAIVHQNNIDRFIGIGSAISAHKHFFKGEKFFFETTDDFLQSVLQFKFQSETILLKGARHFRFENISKHLEQKTHRTVLELDLNAMVNNLNYYRSLLNPETKIMAMVKALSYGSGSFEIANVLQYQRVDYLGVAFTDEGIELRKAGITMPIMVMNPDSDSFEALIQYKLEPEIYSFQGLGAYLNAAKNAGQKKYPLHIKIDSGMHRLGFINQDIKELCQLLNQHQNYLSVKSIFTHLASSENPRHDAFTKQQIDYFQSLARQIIKSTKQHPFLHVLNSAGIERFPHYQFDMVRLGIGLYGYSPVNQDKLHNFSTLKSRISQIKHIKAGESIGYGRAGKTSKMSKIATVSIGYADGLNRRLSNGKGSMWVNGQKAKITGNICMDMCMLDITGLNAKEGDEVIVFGEKYPIHLLAEQLNTIPYEIMTSISQRVKKIYFQE